MSDKNGNSLVGRKNIYTCRTCGHRFVTVDKDDGTTPFMTGCQNLGCTGTAESAFYRVPQELEATHEWYRATPAEARGMKPHMRQHHDMGGLFLRRCTTRMTLRDDVEVKESALSMAVKEARKEATGKEEPTAPKRGFA